MYFRAGPLESGSVRQIGDFPVIPKKEPIAEHDVLLSNPVF